MATLILGPPRSGKTTRALELLAADPRGGVYVGSQRMLVHAARARLQGRVGLVTGEETIPPPSGDGPEFWCCTPESVGGLRGGTLVLDEAHHVHDPERGGPWTRLLLEATGAFERVVACAPVESHDLMRAALRDYSPLVVHRTAPVRELAYLQTDVRLDKLADLPAAFVCYSADGLVAVGAALRKHRPDLRVHVMNGGEAPPERRAEAFGAVARGETDVLVTTSLLAHGIDVPFRTVVFAETAPHAPRRRPTLLELAMIAGRSLGSVGHFPLRARRRGEPSAAGASGMRKVVRLAVEAAMGRLSPRDVSWDVAFAAPSPSEPPATGAVDVACLPLVLQAWEAAPGPAPFVRRVAAFHAWRARTLAAVVCGVERAPARGPLSASPATLPPELVWALVTAPIKDRNFAAVARVALTWELDAPTAVALANDLRIACRTPGLGLTPEVLGVDPDDLYRELVAA